MKNTGSGSFWFLFCFALLFVNTVLAQGGGDAGLLSSGDFDSRSRATDTPSRIYVLERAGLTSDNVISLGSEFQMDWNVWGGINIWFALPYQYTTGSLATAHGVGDLRAVVSHTLAESGDFTVKLNFGGVIPSGRANEEIDGKPLPMVYQVSQGMPSFLASAIFYLKSWSLAAGYQRFFSANENSFTKASWNDDEDVKDFPDSPGLWPGDDLAFRLSKNFDRPKAHYSLSVLPACRLKQDRILNEGKYVSVDGSSGWTLNINAGMEIKLGNYGYFHFLAAVPVVQREVYTDGLDRVVVVTAGFGVQFPE